MQNTPFNEKLKDKMRGYNVISPVTRLETIVYFLRSRRKNKRMLSRDESVFHTYLNSQQKFIQLL